MDATDDSGPIGGDDSPNPRKIRLPSQVEVTTAVEAVPTVRDEEKPDMELPSYLQPTAQTMELELDSTENIPTVDVGTEPTEEMAPVNGFTDRASDDPTEREMEAVRLSSPVIEANEAPEVRPRTTFPLVPVAIAIAVICAIVIFMATRA